MTKLKNMLSVKQISAFALASVLFFSAIPMAFASTPDDATDAEAISDVFAPAEIDVYSMGEIEDILMVYLNENYPELEVGTVEFYEFAVEQLLGEPDMALVNHEDYELIHTYLSEYKLNYEDYLLCASLLQEGTIAARSVTAEILMDNDSVVYDSVEKAVSFDVNSSFRSQTIGEIKEQNKEAYLEMAENDAPSISPFAVYGYNGTAAANYARKYAYSPYNYPAYPYYSQVPIINFGGTDCTNFVSQCLVAGGLAMSGSTTSAGTVTSVSNWYCKTFIKELNNGGVSHTYGVTTSWVRTGDFVTCMSRRLGPANVKDYSTLTSLNNAVKVGDVVGMVNSSGSVYHLVIISVKGSTTSATKFCGHNNDRKDYPISNFSSSDKAWRVFPFAS